MRTVLLLPALTLALSAQTPIVVTAPIQKVRVHPDEAWVTRIAKVRLNVAGTHKVKFPQLPGGLTLDDVRIQAKGPDGTRMGEILVGPDRHIAPETAESKALLAKLEALQQHKNALEGQQTAARKAQEFLDQFQSSLRGDNSRPLPSAGQLVDLNRGLESRVAELHIQSETRAHRLEALEKETQSLESRWQKLRGELDTNPNPSQVTTELLLPCGGEVELELTYRTRQARWKPSYDARLAADGRSLELVLYAAVTQASGEGWENIQIELSNSKPSQVQDLPHFDRVPKLGWMPSAPSMLSATVVVTASSSSVDASMVRSTATSLAGPSYQPPAPKPIQALEPAATLLEDTKGLAKTWILEGRKDVPSDGDAHRFRVADETLHTTVQVVVIPRLDPTPIQVVRFEAPSKLPMFAAAPILRSVGNQRMGQGSLSLPPAGLPFELSFGPYQGLRASLQTLSQRNPFRMSKFAAVRQTMGATVRQSVQEEIVANEPLLKWELQERITLANDTSDELAIEVLDRRIQSIHESVSVEPTPESTPPTREAAPGVNAWLVRIPAKGHAQVDLGWTIRAPKEGELLGLKDLGFN